MEAPPRLQEIQDREFILLSYRKDFDGLWSLIESPPTQFARRRIEFVVLSDGLPDHKDSRLESKLAQRALVHRLSVFDWLVAFDAVTNEPPALRFFVVILPGDPTSWYSRLAVDWVQIYHPISASTNVHGGAPEAMPFGFDYTQLLCDLGVTEGLLQSPEWPRMTIKGQGNAPSRQMIQRLAGTETFLSLYVNFRSVEQVAPDALRPVIFFLDDFNVYVRKAEGRFCRLSDDQLRGEVVKYGALLSLHLDEYCRTLNELGAHFEVQAPRLWIQDVNQGYQSIASVIPFTTIDGMRDRIAAFVVDLQWEPDLSTPRERNVVTGQHAIDLLSRRFPEIPCFVLTANLSTQRQQNALMYGAAWCFTRRPRPDGHGREKEDEREGTFDPERELTPKRLLRQLQTGVFARHGSFSETPYPQQLEMTENDPVATRLANLLGIKLPPDRSPKGRDLQRLIAQMFPDGAPVRPVRIIDTGGSDAQATFFVSSTRDGIKAATRFIKFGPWLEIQREYLAYTTVIAPRLNSFIANVIGGPVLVSNSETVEDRAKRSSSEEVVIPSGALVYSLAGAPEDHECLRSFDQLVRTSSRDRDACIRVCSRLRETFTQVLGQLYGGFPSELTPPKRARRTVHQWLGAVLPPVITGEIVQNLGVGEPRVSELHSFEARGFKGDIAAQLAARELQKTRPSNEVGLRGFVLISARSEPNPDGRGEIMLRHPDLGMRLRCRGRAGFVTDCTREWVRPGFPVDLIIKRDATNEDHERLMRERKRATEALGIQNDISGLVSLAKKFTDEQLHDDPLAAIALDGQLPLHFRVTARVGPIHGDLNTNNILFWGDAGPGWLIDFERARPDGMIAFDLAKLEVEIWHHHLFEILYGLAAHAPKNRAERWLELTLAAFASADAGDEGAALMAAAQNTGGAGTLPAVNLLRVIAEIRVFADRLRLTDEELSWARGLYFLACMKFVPETRPASVVGCQLGASYYVGKVLLPETQAVKRRLQATKLLDNLADGGAGAVAVRDIDALLLAPQRGRTSQGGCDLNNFSKALAGQCVDWESNPKERWDLASTGAVGNLTPIFGYLWLMARAAADPTNPIGVPKISSRGSSCGTVDVLAAGGLHFISDSTDIVRLSRKRGGVLCNPDSLAPADAILMSRRRDISAMKNAALTYSSIIAKKLAIGCTHAIVDVKIGRDCKMVVPGMTDKDLAVLLTEAGHELLGSEKAVRALKRVLTRAGVRGPLEMNEIAGLPVVYQKCSFDQLKQVWWFATNADVPQCRAIGRQLMLLHLDGLIGGRYSFGKLPAETLLLKEENQWQGETTTGYCKLYGRFLSTICGAKELYEGGPEVLRAQWKNLKLDGRIREFPAWKYAGHWHSADGSEDRVKDDKRDTSLPSMTDLAVKNFKLSDYNQKSFGIGKGRVRVQSINAYELDLLFEWLCGRKRFDEEVGVWLHALPGEEISSADTFISVFYRPSRTSVNEVRNRFGEFLADKVRVTKAI